MPQERQVDAVYIALPNHLHCDFKCGLLNRVSMYCAKSLWL